MGVGRGGRKTRLEIVSPMIVRFQSINASLVATAASEAVPIVTLRGQRKYLFTAKVGASAAAYYNTSGEQSDVHAGGCKTVSGPFLSAILRDGKIPYTAT